MDKDKIELKTVMESAAVAEYLTALAKGFKSGRLTIEKDGESLSLAPAEMAEVEVEARVKKDKARFSLEVSWRLMGVEDDPGSLKINADAPRPAVAKIDRAAEAKAQAKPEKKHEMKPEAPAGAPMVKVIASAPAVKPAVPAGPAAGALSTSGVKPVVPGAAASVDVKSGAKSDAKTEAKAAPKA